MKVLHKIFKSAREYNFPALFAYIFCKREQPSNVVENNMHRINSGQIEYLSDEDLQQLNELLPWKCFTLDSKGRKFGNFAWRGKRDTPQKIPDSRIVHLNEIIDLSSRTVLEIGCFEGIHTTALSGFAKIVYAIDSRIENVVKTIVRTNMFGYCPKVWVCDVENHEDLHSLPQVDVIHHVGVLYHLKDPVSHIIELSKSASEAILLDTHYASDEMSTNKYSSNGKEWRYYYYKEHGKKEVFSGMYDHAKWIRLEDIISLLKASGLKNIHIIDKARQRNGPRVTLLATR